MLTIDQVLVPDPGKKQILSFFINYCNQELRFLAYILL